MNNYKPLVWAGTVALWAAAVFLFISTGHVSNSAATTNTISFSGEGKVVAKPDIAVVDLSLVTEAPTSKVAQNDNSKKSNAVVDFLKKQDVDEKDIKTTGYNIYPQYSYPQYGKPTITGYQVTETIHVKIRDLDKVDEILDGVVSAGANQVTNLQLTVDDIQKVRDDAREKAIEDAKDKAKSLRSQLGISLGKIIGFSENGNYPTPIMYDQASMVKGMGGGMGGGPSIPSGENEIVVDVTLTYQVK